MGDDKTNLPISKQTLKRLPYYLNYLKHHPSEGGGVSAKTIATYLELSEIQVRKDLAMVSIAGGKPKIGFDRVELINDIESFLGYNNVDRAALVGVGRLGVSLLYYEGFSNCGVELYAVFDNDPALIGQKICGYEVFDVNLLSSVVKRLNIHIGIITVPANCAQDICERMTSGGVLAIWNFSPVMLKTSDNILVRNENMAGSLTMLSHHLTQRLTNNNEELEI